MRVEALGLTDVGQMRARNEDAFEIDPQRNLVVVADGMGGHGNGDVASKIAAQAVLESMREQADETQTGPPPEAPSQLRRAVASAHEKVLAAIEEDAKLAGMGTTLVTLWLRDGRMWIAHVGDSRAYRLRNGSLELLTHDHSWVNEQVAAGNLSEDQARSHPLKSVVTRALGGDTLCEAEVQEVEPQEGDRFLICSDGLTTMLTDEDIADRLQFGGSLEEICQRLVADSNARGGFDNITVVIAEISS